MSGPLAVFAKVARRGNDSTPEMVLPEAVHHHARGQRVFWIDDPLRQRHSPTSRWELAVAVGLQDGRLDVACNKTRKTRFHSFAGLPVIPADEHTRWCDHRAGGRSRNVFDR